MSLNLKRPCKRCPFKAVPENNGWLGEVRAKDIIHSIAINQQSFICHETTHKHKEHCAGAAILMVKENCPNQIMQVATRLGDPFVANLTKHETVYDSFEEFIAAHGDKT